MSTQELDVRKSWRALRRHRWLLTWVTAAGVAGGIVFALINPPMHTAASLVVLPPPVANSGSSDSSTAAQQSIDTHVFIAGSEPVLRSAGQNVSPPLSAEVLRDRVKVSARTGDVIEIKASGTTPRQAVSLANAVAGVYLVFVTTNQKLPGDLGNKTGARILEEATTARSGNLVTHLGTFGGLGGLAGLLAGTIAILTVARGDRRLRLRDEIADSVGIPVLASISSYRAKDVSDWANLLERYSPSAVDAWSLRKTLHRLGLDPKGGPPVSVTVITFSDDERARPLGPQLAAFATSIGIPAVLVVDSEYDSSPDGEPEEPGRPRRLLGDDPEVGAAASKVGLDVQLLVVDRRAPHLAGAVNTTTTVIGLSAGAVTAEELARLAVAAAAADRSIDGLIVADPDPTDRTLGRVAPSSLGSNSRLPTLLTGTARRTSR